MFCLELLRGFECARYHQRQCADRRIFAGAQNFGCAQRVDDLAVRNLALRWIKRLVLERKLPDQDRARTRPRPMTSRAGSRAPPRVPGSSCTSSRRSGCVAQTANPHHFRTHHQRAPADLPVRRNGFGKFVGDVVEAHGEEIREHDLGDRLQAVIAAPSQRPEWPARKSACHARAIVQIARMSPTVALNTPPALATSSPRNTTSGSRLISCAMPRMTASR